jgi:hypothetical protein
MLELGLMSELLQDKHNVALQSVTERQYTFTVTWIESCQYFGEGVSPSWASWSQNLTTVRFILWYFVQDVVNVSPVLITMNGLRERRRLSTTKIEHLLLQSVWHDAE